MESYSSQSSLVVKGTVYIPPEPEARRQLALKITLVALGILMVGVGLTTFFVGQLILPQLLSSTLNRWVMASVFGGASLCLFISALIAHFCQRKGASMTNEEEEESTDSAEESSSLSEDSTPLGDKGIYDGMARLENGIQICYIIEGSDIRSEKLKEILDDVKEDDPQALLTRGVDSITNHYEEGTKGIITFLKDGICHATSLDCEQCVKVVSEREKISFELATDESGNNNNAINVSHDCTGKTIYLKFSATEIYSFSPKFFE